MSSRKPTGLVTGERFTGTMTRLSNSTSIAWDVLQYGVPPVVNSPNATFSISLIDGNTDIVTPYAAVFRATNFSGFNVSEPAGTDNVYDPTQHKITFIWDFDDAAYTPITALNIPTAWRNLNIAYGKQVAHVWHTGGNKTVSCFAFDDAGNWGTATYTFATGGNSPAIVAADTFYSGTNTIVWSQAGNFTGAPAGSTQCTTLAQVHTALAALASGGGNNRAYRILLRAGETFTDNFWFHLSSGAANYPGGPTVSYRETLKGILFGSFGSGARPIIDARRNSFVGQAGGVAGISVVLPDRSDCRQFIFSDLDIRYEWDAATETGYSRYPTRMNGVKCTSIMTRCRFSGCDDIGLDRAGQATRWTIVHDCEVTNWSNYGAYMDIETHAMIGCDIAQKADALAGIQQGTTGSQNPWTFGNRHGPYRSGSRVYDTIFSCVSFYSRNGWSGSGGNWNTQPPTAEQPCVRFHNHFDSAGVPLRRHHHVFDRCSFEGGWSVVAQFGSAGGAPQAFVETNAKNLVIDKCLFVATGGTTGNLVDITLSGVTLRNSYFYRHSVAPIATGSADAELRFSRVSNGTLTGVGPVEVYNNTFINNRTSGFNGGYAPIRVDAGFGGNTVANNVVRVVNRAGFEGASFAPLSSTPLAGFTCRYNVGPRWNFPPIASTLDLSTNTWTPTAFREQPGSPGVLQPGDVANLEWVFLPYPDWTGRCNGAGTTLGVLTAAEIIANPTQKHVVSITNVSTKLMGDSALWSQADGRVAFDFHASGIRIQNRTGSTWTSTSGTIAVLLDMSSYLMAPLSSAASPATIPVSTPLAGSSALSTASGLIAYDDGLATPRPGKRLDDGSFKTGLASQGWVEPT